MATALANRIVVIDDDEEGRDGLMDDLRGFNFEPLTIIGPYGQELDRMLSDIEEQQPSFVICDHKLQPAGLASFFGADVVKRLVAQGIPAMLLTMYQSTDRLDLRASRYELPVVLGRDQFRPERVPQYYEVCHRELASQPVDARRPHRTLIRVDDVQRGSGLQARVDAVVPSWSPDHAISVPTSCIDHALLPLITRGTYLLGDVNIGAECEDELFFRNLNEIVAPEDIWS